ncbi:rho GTPase-activating protein 12b isoform X2 [Boleophthalmus pectinirostris]|uniref:rho GTPase-activating protein 12b isoform X2 n=1 Tax=Boleophthalmus pectinirostris TaxID=150288 RepID=UPI00242A6DFD|nr:rho GTPase-activating protein 12b isoform X2 [Boleophthalmus pectinirostris]
MRTRAPDTTHYTTLHHPAAPSTQRTDTHRAHGASAHRRPERRPGSTAAQRTGSDPTSGSNFPRTISALSPGHRRRRSGLVHCSHEEPHPSPLSCRGQRSSSVSGADMADREGPPMAPGQVYIEVEYDYEYKAKDKLVTIRQGECYLLVKKTNEDWWQVRRDEGTKTFYVPAQYVREVRRALLPPLKPSVRAKPSVLEICRASDENLNRPQPEMTSFGRPPPSSTPSPSSDRVTPPALHRDPNQNPNNQTHSNQPPNNPPHQPLGSPQHCKVVAELVLLHNNNNHHLNALQRTRSDSPPLRGPAHSRSPDSDQAASPCAPSPHALRHDSESGDELSSSSTEHMQSSSPTGPGRSDSPVYTNLQELKISQSNLPPVPSGSPLHLHGDWETHRDTSGRHFYYNRATGERTWKPPRTRDTASTSSMKGDGHRGDSLKRDGHRGDSLKGDSHRGDSLRRDNQGPVETEPLSSEENCNSTHSSQSDSQYGSPPRGWSEELDEHGHTTYVSEYTQEKWIKHVDEQGRPYYYSADGSRSEWELPKYNISPQSGELPKSRSLERKQQEPIVLTKWRHSTYVLDLNDKENAPAGPKQSSPDSDSCPSSPKHPNTPSEKCGVLNVTKITENGKKVRKNWASSWTVLQGSSLLFAKGQGGTTSWFGGNQSKPEFTVDLRGGSVEWASKDKSSKKHVIELKTRVGTELLIQSEIDSVINDWYRALSDTVSTHAWESDEAIEEDMPESPGAEKQDKEKEHRDSKKNRVMKTSVSMDVSDQKKTRMKLKKFLIRRPTYQAVRDKGYIKDTVFGCSLSALCQRENSTVPKFVRMCIDHVEDTGLDVDGLYRVSGNLAVIQKLRFAVNHDEKLELDDSKWEDIHVTTGALKMFFRELPEPLFTYTSFNDFVNAIKCQDYKQRLNSIRDLIKKLPKPNHDTMQALFKHLRRVVEHGEANRMTTQSVAIVFGPTLLRPETESGNIAVHMVYQNQIVELILIEYDSVFGR